MLDLHGAMVDEDLRRRRRRAAAAHPRGCAESADRPGARHAREPVSGNRRARRRDRRLSDLSAHRHGRNRGTRRPRAAEDARWLREADDGVGQRADAAARDAPGHRRLSERATAGARARNGARRRARGQPVHRLPARRHRTGRPVGGRGHRQRHRQAEVWRDELLDRAWNDRAAFVYRPEPLADSVARAKRSARGRATARCILLDHYDNTASGGTMDTTEVLAEILRAGARRRRRVRHLRSRRRTGNGARGRRQPDNGFTRGQARRCRRSSGRASRCPSPAA